MASSVTSAAVLTAPSKLNVDTQHDRRRSPATSIVDNHKCPRSYPHHSHHCRCHSPVLLSFEPSSESELDPDYYSHVGHEDEHDPARPHHANRRPLSDGDGCGRHCPNSDNVRR